MDENKFLSLTVSAVFSMLVVALLVTAGASLVFIASAILQAVL